MSDIEMTERERELAAKAWDEGYSYLFTTQRDAGLNDDAIVVTSLDDNPYRQEARA